jgi:flagellar assembly factor FliW
MMRGELAMSGSGAAAFPQGLVAQSFPEAQEVQSRFGPITIQPANAIAFPNGLLGMPGKMQFCLARFPIEKMARFSVLQSLSDPNLAFITLPIDVRNNTLIDQADLEQAAKDLDLPLSDLLVLLIVTVHRESGGTKLSVNARAPVLVRVSMKLAAQYVFPHAKYQIRQPLTL